MKYLEEEHISKNTDVLLKHFQTNITKKESVQSNYPNEKHLKNKNYFCSNYVVIENYWIKLSEYLILYEEFKKLSLLEIKTIELQYIEGRLKNRDYYSIILKILYKN